MQERVVYFYILGKFLFPKSLIAFEISSFSSKTQIDENKGRLKSLCSISIFNIYNIV